MKRLIILLSVICFGLTANGQSTIHPDSTLVKIKCVDQDLIVEDSVLVELFHPDGKPAAKVYADIYGKAQCMVKRGINYGLKTTKYNTTKEQLPLDCQNAKMNLRIKINFYDKKYGAKWEIAVFFKSNEHTLDFDDLAALNALYDKLDSNKSMRIEIAAHTDNVGNDRYNMALSQRRANSVRSYLIGKGIDENRLFSKGYGETEPIATNETDAGRAKNRRVEVRVLQF